MAPNEDNDHPEAPHQGVKQLSRDEKMQILALYHTGRNPAQIGTQLNRHPTGIRKFLKRFEQLGTIERQEGQGRPRKTTDRNDRRAILLMKRDRFMTSREIQAEVDLTTVSNRTIRRRLIESGEFTSQWAVKKPFISETNRRKRLSSGGETC